MKIALLGDIALFGKYSTENKSIGIYFKEMALLLRQFDFVVGNLETPLLNHGQKYGAKSAHIKALEENVEILKMLNVNVVNLANNHIYDYGRKGYESTVRILKENNIQYFGVDNKTLYLNSDNCKVAFTGYCCYSTNLLGCFDKSTQKGVNILDGFEMEQTLLNNHENGYLNISSVHAGQEHVNYPSVDHIKLARMISKKVPFLYYGHHPHVIQGIEVINKLPIAYSLGNFCFDDVYTSKSKAPLIEQTNENKKSYILCLDIEGNIVNDYTVVPFFLGDSRVQMYREDISKEIREYSKFLNKSYQKIELKRSELLDNYYALRKLRRTMEWYIKRLNLKSVKMIIGAKRNSRNYKKVIINYINSRGNNA